MITLALTVMACAWMLTLLRTGPWGWRALNKLGAALGRSIAWFMLGGLGLWMARYQLGQDRIAREIGELQARLAAERERVRMLRVPPPAPCDCAWCARSPGQRAAWD